MTELRPPSLLDFARETSISSEETFNNLLAYYQRGAVHIHYRPARQAARAVFSGEIRLEAALAAAEAEKNATIRKINCDVTRLIWNQAKGRNPMRCVRVGPFHFSLNQSTAIRVAPEFLFSEGGKLKVFWLQPRKSFALSDYELKVVSTILRQSLDDNGLEGCGLFLLDCSVNQGETERSVKTYSFDSIGQLDPDELHLLASNFLDAFSVLSNMNIARKSSRKKKSKEDDNKQGGFEF